MQTADPMRLAHSLHAALIEGGVSKDLADALLAVGTGISLLVQASSAATTDASTLDAEIGRVAGQIEREMKRSSNNLIAVLRTACRDSSPLALRLKIEQIVQEHVKFEVFALQVLMDRRTEAKAAEVKLQTAKSSKSA